MDSRTVTGPIDRLARLGAGFFLPVVLPVKQAREARAVAASKRTASRGPRPVVPDPQPAISGSGSPGQSRLNGGSDPSSEARDPARTARAWQACTCAGFTKTIHNKNQRSPKGL